MAVMITTECISCDACAPECPVAAILPEEDEKNPSDGVFYVKPESCVECVGHADKPRCVEACPTEGAIVSVSEAPIDSAEHTYVKPEKCIECVDSTVPKCADVCPSEGAIVWDMPYTEEFDEYYMKGHQEGFYKIRVHNKKGIFSPANQPRPFREGIEMSARTCHKNVI